MNPILASYKVEYDEEEDDDESWIDRPWSETGEPEWCGRSCCQEIIMAAQEVVRLPQEEQPELKFPQGRAACDGAAPGEAAHDGAAPGGQLVMRMPQGEQPVMGLPQEGQLVMRLPQERQSVMGLPRRSSL